MQHGKVLSLGVCSLGRNAAKKKLHHHHHLPEQNSRGCTAGESSGEGSPIFQITKLRLRKVSSCLRTHNGDVKELGLKADLHVQVRSCLSCTTSQGNDAALWVKAVHTNNTAKGNGLSGRLRGSLPRSLQSMWQERYFHSLLVEVKMGTAVLERNSTVHIRNL